MMMLSSSGSPRIVKRKITNDVSYTFSVCKHVRLMGRPTHIELAKIGTFRQSEFDKVAGQFWEIVDAELTKLVNKKILWNADRSKVESAFAKHIPRPVPAVSISDDVNETSYEIMQSLIAKIEAEKARRKLEESGIHL